MNRGQSNKLDFKGQNIYVGIDAHLKSWSVAVLSQHSVLKKFRQDPSPESLHKFLTTHYPGADYRTEDLRGCGGGISTIPCNLANPVFYDVAVRRGVECRM
jgi:hypothetical protein